MQKEPWFPKIELEKILYLNIINCVMQKEALEIVFDPSEDAFVYVFGEYGNQRATNVVICAICILCMSFH